MNRDLFLAVLAMDSYNRGYNQGVVFGGNIIGNATIVTDSENVPSTKDTGKSESFYAVAYQLNGETIISYPICKDSGWTISMDFGSFRSLNVTSVGSA